MNSKKENVKRNIELVQKIKQAKETDQGVVTFHFEDGTKQVQHINKAIFTDERGKPTQFYSIVKLFKEICWDLKAKYFTL